jgi:hypothetical protein
MAAAVIEPTDDVRVTRPRLTAKDVIVLVGALVAFLAGWAIKDALDNRLRTVAVGDVTVSYPRDWIPFSTTEPELFRAFSNDDGRIVALLAAVQTPQTDVLQAVTTNNANPARGEPGYTQLANTTGTVDGNQAVVTDYAYVQSTPGSATVPTVIRGRQYAWLKNGQLYVIAVEGPEGDWNQLRDDADRMAGKIET